MDGLQKERAEFLTTRWSKYIDCHRQHVVYSPFISSEQRSVYAPNRTAAVETTDDGKIVESRDNPRAAFEGHGRETQWDNLHSIYFSGYTMWTYLTSPFPLKLPNVRTEEIEPWEGQGDAWRRLKATFPPEIATHSTEQVFYFDKTGLLRRQDYNATRTFSQAFLRLTKRPGIRNFRD